MKRLISAVLVLSAIIITSANAAQQMAIWDFGDSSAYYTLAPTAENVVGTPTMVLSGGTLDPDGKNGVIYTDAAGISHIAGQAGAWDDVKISSSPDAKWIVTLDTTGWTDISIRFDYKAWDAKTTSFDLSYQIDNSGTWVSILNDQTIIADKAFHIFSASLADIDAIENCSSVQLKVSDLDRVGNNEFAFDNYELIGTQIPEPATVALFGLGITAIIRRRRK
jgi:hypothetical protein